MQLVNPDDPCLCKGELRWAECCGRALPLTLRFMPIRLLEAGDQVLAGCTKGGHCCRNVHVPLTPFDVLRLARYLGVNTGELLSEIAVVTLDGGVEIEGTPECPFLEGDSCSVYSHRPDSCRLYPFWLVPSGNSRYLVERHTCMGCWQECRGQAMEVGQLLQKSDLAPGQEMEAIYRKAIRELEEAGISEELVEEFMLAVYNSDSSVPFREPVQSTISELSLYFQQVIQGVKGELLQQGCSGSAQIFKDEQ